MIDSSNEFFLFMIVSNQRAVSLYRFPPHDKIFAPRLFPGNRTIEFPNWQFSHGQFPGSGWGFFFGVSWGEKLNGNYTKISHVFTVTDGSGGILNF